jgi:PAS domain S-box-containing protein
MTATASPASLRVLMVEDEADDADLVMRELNRAGLHAEQRRIMTAPELRAALAESEWDLVLADYQLPQFSAPAALEVLQSSGHDLPFIVVSGTVGEETAVEVLRAGAHDFMVKGNLARLGPAVQRELREAQRRADRRQMEALLHVSEERLRMLVNGVQDYAIIMLDADGRVMTWNPAAQRILGYTTEEILTHDYASFYTPEDVARGWPARMLQSAAEAGRVEAEGWRVRRDASHFWAEGVITTMRDQDGRLLGFGDVSRDCTARRLADQERAESLVREQSARAEAEAAVRTRDEFLSIASHELRTPVAGIKAAAQLLLRWQNRGALNGERLESSLLDLERSASRLAQLTEDLLDVGRLQDGRLLLRPMSIDLKEIVARIVDRYRAQIPESHSIALDLPRRDCCLVADPARIEQIVTNLLENAVKYSPAGGTVCVRLRVQRGGFLLCVIDSGIGLPPGATEVIFQPFGRAPNSTAQHLPGMGLGLYICRQIAEAHGGRIWAESLGENQGTTMSLWLPATGVVTQLTVT